ncbi:hypothetical protein LA76x_2054 [Lysobacter antibioticus]|uniref:Uncharacterized protein n=1 Tax=Lysobacter antibioticus TaxID=84531 RepID=A0A0S2F9I4_LYSAN|nr:hypothetical protein LA76x_2054 [Lysobacter antibioticus]
MMGGAFRCDGGTGWQDLRRRSGECPPAALAGAGRRSHKCGEGGRAARAHGRAAVTRGAGQRASVETRGLTGRRVP